MTTSALLVEQALLSPQYVQVRRRLLRQLLESLIYEGVLAAHPAGDGDRHTIDGTGAQGEPVRYLFTLTRRLGFARIRLGPDPVLRSAGGGQTEAQSLTLLLAELHEALGAEPDRLTGFARELEETLVKDAVAQHVRARRADVLAGAAYDELECLITDGHPYHPTFKSRVGFDAADNLAFGPEFAQPVRPLWLAARRGPATVTISAALDEDRFLRGQLGSATVEEFTDRIRAAGADPAGYTLVPVHPWQWRERIAHGFAAALRVRDLIVLGEDPHAHLPQQSIRTLACTDDPQRPYLKLSLSILNTSTTRVLAPHTVGNAPLISDWLRRVVGTDGYLRDELRTILLGEVMGTSVDAEPGLLGEDGYGALGCIWRQSLHAHLDPHEQAVPFTGLIARELDGTPLVDPWVRELGVRRWAEELLAVAVPPLVHLLEGHGIALEAHAQNMVLVHVDGRPARVALRDFHDGVRFCRSRLADPDACPPLAATPAHHGNRNSFVETEDLDLVTDFLLDAFFFINLGELALFLDGAYGLPEREFWAAARGQVETYQRRFPELAERFAQFDVFKPELDVEQLTTRRLLPDTELRMHTVPNPLAASGQEA
ncbi:MAG: siderophore biosynthesis protein [Pseudonocardiaceae bacterium]|nr:siderophore biosynthesis protein [Pseudonocardiaceae bacterium]